MAWYHVGSCSCPEGCCDCGSVDPKPVVKESQRLKYYNIFCPACGETWKDCFCLEPYYDPTREEMENAKA